DDFDRHRSGVGQSAVFAVDRETAAVRVLITEPEIEAALGVSINELDNFMTATRNGDVLLVDDGGPYVFRVTPTGDVSILLGPSDFPDPATGVQADPDGGIDFDSRGNLLLAQDAGGSSVLRWPADDPIAGTVQTGAAGTFVTGAEVNAALGQSRTIDFEGGFVIVSELIELQAGAGLRIERCAGPSVSVHRDEPAVVCFSLSNPGTDLLDVVLVHDGASPADPSDDAPVSLSGLTDVDGDGSADDLPSGAIATGSVWVRFTEAGDRVVTARLEGRTALGSVVQTRAEARVEVLPEGAPRLQGGASGCRFVGDRRAPDAGSVLPWLLAVFGLLVVRGGRRQAAPPAA
ncbi:MAG: hypothetical protein D6776_01640, partial [Planctomycetota bacterium]